MSRQRSVRRSRVAGFAGLLALSLCAMNLAAHEGVDSSAIPDEISQPGNTQEQIPVALPADAWDFALSAAVLPDADVQPQASIARAPAQELATGLNIQVQKKRRKFRARAVNWMADVSPAAGAMTDFLLGGADSGWHLVLDPTGTDEYIIEWKARFR